MTAGARGRPGWGAKLSLVLASLAFVFVLAEASLRAFWKQPLDGVGPDAVGLGVKELAKENLDGLFIGIPFRTNSRGIRGPEYATRAAEGVVRFIVTGDSVTMGWRVEESEAYPVVLERLLNEAEDGSRYESINVGLAGINIEGAMDRLEAMTEVYSPDVLIYGFTINDIEGPAYRKKQSPMRAMALMQRYRAYADSPSYVLRFFWPRYQSLRERLSPTLTPYSETLHDNYFDNPPAWQAVEDGLDRLAALAELHGVCAHLLIHAELSELDPVLHPYHDIYDRVARAAMERGISVSRSFPYFVGRDPARMKAAFLDSHPGPEGHELLAAALLEGWRALPASCFGTVHETDDVGS